MRPFLAHQGGWDEMLVAGCLVLAVMGIGRLRRHRDERRGDEHRPSPEARADACAYCGAALPPDAHRCASCGFRVRG